MPEKYLSSTVPVAGMIFIHEAFHLGRPLQYFVDLFFQLAPSQSVDHDHTMLMMSNSKIQVTLKFIELYRQDGNVLQSPPFSNKVFYMQVQFVFGL